MTPNTIEFNTVPDNTWIMRLTADRRIEVNEDVEVTVAAQKVLEAMQILLNPPYKSEPVAAESKFTTESTWGKCSIEHHNLVQSEPHKWPGYQTRLLYTMEKLGKS